MRRRSAGAGSIRECPENLRREAAHCWTRSEPCCERTGTALRRRRTTVANSGDYAIPQTVSAGCAGKVAPLSVSAAEAVGEVIVKLPLPGDPAAGPMHAIPHLQWRTWVRLALVDADSDSRSLNRLRVVDGTLADYFIVSGTLKWTARRNTVELTGRHGHGPQSSTQRRIFCCRSAIRWRRLSRVWRPRIGSSRARPSPGKAAAGSGAFSIAGPRVGDHQYTRTFIV